MGNIDKIRGFTLNDLFGLLAFLEKKFLDSEFQNCYFIPGTRNVYQNILVES